MADASDGLGSSLSLGLAHDVFALPLLLLSASLCSFALPLLQCQQFNPASASATSPRPSLTKVGPSVPRTFIRLRLWCYAKSQDLRYQPFPPSLCAALSGTMKTLICQECLLQLLCMLCIYCNLLGKMMLSHCSLHRFPNWSAAEQ